MKPLRLKCKRALYLQVCYCRFSFSVARLSSIFGFHLYRWTFDRNWFWLKLNRTVLPNENICFTTILVVNCSSVDTSFAIRSAGVHFPIWRIYSGTIIDITREFFFHGFCVCSLSFTEQKCKLSIYLELVT